MNLRNVTGLLNSSGWLARAFSDDPNSSYYAGGGLNASRTNVDEVMKAIDLITTE